MNQIRAHTLLSRGVCVCTRLEKNNLKSLWTPHLLIFKPSMVKLLAWVWNWKQCHVLTESSHLFSIAIVLIGVAGNWSLYQLTSIKRWGAIWTGCRTTTGHMHVHVHARAHTHTHTNDLWTIEEYLLCGQNVLLSWEEQWNSPLPTQIQSQISF